MPTIHLILAVDGASIELEKQLHGIGIPPQGSEVERRVPVLVMISTNSDYQCSLQLIHSQYTACKLFLIGNRPGQEQEIKCKSEQIPLVHNNIATIIYYIMFTSSCKVELAPLESRLSIFMSCSLICSTEPYNRQTNLIAVSN